MTNLKLEYTSTSIETLLQCFNEMVFNRSWSTEEIEFLLVIVIETFNIMMLQNV